MTMMALMFLLPVLPLQLALLDFSARDRHNARRQSLEFLKRRFLAL